MTQSFAIAEIKERGFACNRVSCGGKPEKQGAYQGGVYGLSPEMII
jgi:hypothetical protein